MRKTRTWPHDRLFFAGSPRRTSVRGRVRAVIQELLWLVFVGSALLAAVAGGVSFSSWTPKDGSPLSGEHPIHRLARPLSSEERAAGIVRGEGRVLGGAPEAIGPLCAVVQKRRSGKSTFEEYRGIFTSGGAIEIGGERLALDASATRRLSFQPDRLERASEPLEARIRAVAREIPAGGWIEVRCASAGEAVFVEGCRVRTAKGEAALGACPGAPLYVTRGGKQARIDAAAASLAAPLAGCAVLVMALLFYLSILLEFRPVVYVLGRRSPRPPLPGGNMAYLLVWSLPVLGCVGIGLSRLALPSGSPALGFSRLPYVFALGALSLALTAVLHAWRDRRHVFAATEHVVQTPTSPLSTAAGRTVELALRVRRDAKVVRGPLSGEPRAFFWITTEEFFTVGSGKHSSIRRKKVHEHIDPPEIPVEDDSGKGTLVLQGVDLDVRAVEHLVEPEESPAHPQTCGLPRESRHRGFLVRENYIEPGEWLYVLGPVARVRAEDVASAAYRAAPSTDARIEAREGARLFVYGGTEASLLRVAARARAHANVFLVAWSAVAASVASAIAYLAAR